MPGAAQYVKLEQRLVLLAWLNGHFGYDSNRDLLADGKPVLYLVSETKASVKEARRVRRQGHVRGQR